MAVAASSGLASRGLLLKVRTSTRFLAVLIVLTSAYLVVMVAGFVALARAPGDYGFTLSRAEPDGTTVLATRPGGALDVAGVKPGDVIVTDLHMQRQPGTTVRLQVRRGSTGQLDDVEVQLQPRPQSPSAPDLWTHLDTYLEFDLLGFVYAAIGLAVVVIRPHATGARLLLAAGMLWAFQAALFPWEYSGEGQGNAYEWLVSHVCRLATALFGAAVLHLFLAFPTPTAWLRRLQRLGSARVRRLGGGVALLYAPAVLTILVPSDLLLLVTVGLVVAYLLASVAAIASRYRHRGDRLIRAQLKWITWGVVVLAAGLIFGPLLYAVSGRELPLPFLAYVALAAVLPGSIALAILRYRLFDVDRVIRETATYLSLMGLLMLAFGAFNLVGRQIAGAVAGAEGLNPTIASAAAGTLTAALVFPLRRRLQDVLERRARPTLVARKQFQAHAASVLGSAQPVEVLTSFLTEAPLRDLGLNNAWLVVPPREHRPGVSIPLLPGPPEPLLDNLKGRDTPVLLGSDRAADSWLPRLQPDNPVVVHWFEAGARILVPLRTTPLTSGPQDWHNDRAGPDPERGLVGAWVLGSSSSGWDAPDEDDLLMLERVARQAAVLLDYALLHAAESLSQKNT